MTQLGSRICVVTLVGYAVRFPVTHGYVSRLRDPIPGYVWLRQSVTKPGYRLRVVTLVGYAARFPVTQFGCRLRMVTWVGYATWFPVTRDNVSRLR